MQSEQLSLFEPTPPDVQYKIDHCRDEFSSLSAMRRFAEWYSGLDKTATWIRDNWERFEIEWKAQTPKEYWK